MIQRSVVKGSILFKIVTVMVTSLTPLPCVRSLTIHCGEQDNNGPVSVSASKYNGVVGAFLEFTRFVRALSSNQQMEIILRARGGTLCANPDTNSRNLGRPISRGQVRD